MRALAVALAIVPFASASIQHRQAHNDNTITIDTSQTFQIIDGLGFSEAFQRSNQLHGLFGLSATNQSKVVDLLFSDTDGAGLTILRNGIGSSPNDTYDHMQSIEPVSPGSPNATPNYIWDGNDNSQVWLSQQAMKYGVKTIYADAWSAPGYMKDNFTENWGGYLCGVTGTNCTTGDWRQAYANYLIQYIRLYEQSNITITHLGWLNEPDVSVYYASMLSSGTQSADFLRILAPTLAASNLNHKPQIACCDATGWRQQADFLTEIDQAGATDLFDLVTSHGYQSEPGLPFKTPHRVWQTEWADLSGGYTKDWDTFGQVGEGIQWANKIQECFTLSNCSAFLHWIGAESGSGNSALIRLNSTGDPDSYEVTKRLWAFAQFSRWVKPGALRVASSSANGVLHTSAFVNEDGRLAVQIINNGHVDAHVPVQVSGMSGNSAKAWLTNNENDLTEVSVHQGNGSVIGMVPKRSMVSFVIS